MSSTLDTEAWDESFGVASLCIYARAESSWCQSSWNTGSAYEPGGDTAYATSYNLNLLTDLTVSRDGATGAETIFWFITVDGTLALVRTATNELTYQFYDLANNPTATFETWLQRQVSIGGTNCYVRVSNVLSYSQCMATWITDSAYDPGCMPLRDSLEPSTRRRCSL